MKKVLFLIHDLSVGGAEKVLVNLVNNMDYQKFDVSVLALFGGGVNERFLNGQVHYRFVFKKPFRGNSWLMKVFSPQLLHKLFIKEKYDIEISYLEGPTARIISGCPNEKTKTVGWIHSTLKTPKVFSVGFRNYNEAQECYKKLDKIICVSQDVKEYFIKSIDQIVDVDVLYNTNETSKIELLKQEKVEQSFIDNKAIKICSVGRVIPIKGFDRLARIHKRLIQEGYRIHTYILGVGSETENIKKYCFDEGIESSFTFLGYQINPYKYVANSDLFVCSSYSEGFSTAATESLVVGTPVVTTLVSGMEEMLGKNNEYGIIVDNDEEALYCAIKELIENPQLLLNYKEKAKERGQYFSAENTVKAVENMLLKLGEKYESFSY